MTVKGGGLVHQEEETGSIRNEFHPAKSGASNTIKPKREKGKKVMKIYQAVVIMVLATVSIGQAADTPGNTEVFADYLIIISADLTQTPEVPTASAGDSVKTPVLVLIGGLDEGSTVEFGFYATRDEEKFARGISDSLNAWLATPGKDLHPNTRFFTLRNPKPDSWFSLADKEPGRCILRIMLGSDVSGDEGIAEEFQNLGVDGLGKMVSKACRANISLLGE